MRHRTVRLLRKDSEKRHVEIIIVMSLRAAALTLVALPGCAQRGRPVVRLLLLGVALTWRGSRSPDCAPCLGRPPQGPELRSDVKKCPFCT